MRSLSLDLETMSTQPNAAITAIAMVEFHHDEDIVDPATGELGPRFDRSFYRAVHLATSVATGGVIDAPAVLFWLQQDLAVIQKMTFSALPIEVALRETADFMIETAGGEELVLYSRGTMDCTWLRTAMERVGITPPWAYWMERDSRTIRKLYPSIKEPEFIGLKHYALDDAIHEAKLIWNIHYALNRRPRVS